MPGPYTLAQRTQLASQIDTELGTTASQTDSATIDLLLDYVGLLINRIAALEATQKTLVEQG